MFTSKRRSIQVSIVAFAAIVVAVAAGELTSPSISAPACVTEGAAIYGTAYGCDPIEVAAKYTDTLEQIGTTDTSSANGQNDFCFATASGDAGRTVIITMLDGLGRTRSVFVEIKEAP